MASTTIIRASQALFPAGTSVSAYTQAKFRDHLDTGAAPPSYVGSAAATATVAADGSLTFSGLTAGTPYYAYASVSSHPRYVGFVASSEDNVTSAITTSSSQVLAANASRKQVTVVNNGTVPVYVNKGGSAVQGRGVLIAPGGTWATKDTGAIHVIGVGGSGSVITEEK